MKRERALEIAFDMFMVVLWLTIILGIADSVFGQCGPGGCPVGPSYQYQPRTAAPRYQPAHPPTVPMRTMTHNVPRPAVVPTVVKVKAATGGGSGVHVWSVQGKDLAVVATAAHIFRGEENCQPHVRFPNGEGFWAVLKVCDHKHDIALLLIRKPKVLPACLSDRRATVGTRAVVAGYSMGHTFKACRTYVRGYHSGPTTGYEYGLMLPGRVDSGVSGGAVFGENGRLIGIVWGSDERDVTAVSVEYLRYHLSEVLESYRPKPPEQDPSPAPNDSPKPYTQMQDSDEDPIPVPSPVTSTPPTGPTEPEPHKADLQRVFERLDAIDGKLTKIENLARRNELDISVHKSSLSEATRSRKELLTQIHANETRISVVRQSASNGWRPSSDDIDALVDVAAGKLPPLRIQTLNPDGSVHQDVQARLGDLVKLKPVIVQSSGEQDARGTHP